METQKKLLLVLTFLISSVIIVENMPTINEIFLQKFPPISKRPNAIERDDCINKKDLQGCNSLKEPQKTECYKIQNETDELMQSSDKQTDACQKFELYLDKGEHRLPLEDSYYQCVLDCKQVAMKNDFYYKHFFQPVFEYCGVKH